MIEELGLLKEKYPHLFPEHFFFECGDGWFNILSSLLYRINKHEEHVRQNNAYRVRHGRDPIKYKSVKIVQIKEKFGGLRFYFDGGDEYICGAVALAEDMSYKTCEECGDPGTVAEKGWYRVRCQECRDNAYVDGE